MLFVLKFPTSMAFRYCPVFIVISSLHLFSFLFIMQNDLKDTGEVNLDAQ